jgi:adenosylhomocysteine nucleosidase
MPAARVGVGASLPLPAGRVVSFGVAGALVPGLEPGDLVTATRIVAEDGATLWEGEPLRVTGARAVVVCAASSLVDDPGERASLAKRTGAAATNLESGALAATGRLAGVLWAVSDTAANPVGRVGRAVTPAGGVKWAALAAAFVREPGRAIRAAVHGRRALAALERAAAELAGGSFAGTEAGGPPVRAGPKARGLS